MRAKMVLKGYKEKYKKKKKEHGGERKRERDRLIRLELAALSLSQGRAGSLHKTECLPILQSLC